MSNIFVKLSASPVFKREPLVKMIGEKDFAGKVETLMDTFFVQDEQLGTGKSNSEYCDFLLSLIQAVKLEENKDKLMVILVYYLVNIDAKQTIEKLSRVLAWKQSIVYRVKLFSLVFKSSDEPAVKKWVVNNSVELIQKEPKISFFSSFVENFDALMSTFSQKVLSSDEAIKIYSKLIAYLEQHIIYKKLWPTYLAKALRYVNDENAQSEDVSAMIVKIIKSNTVTEQTLKILNHKPLSQNKLFPTLEIYLTGDFQNFQEAHRNEIQNYGVNIDQLQRKMKIQSIPRLFTSTKLASYEQIATMLQIKKERVEEYIIEAIRDGIIKAKLDEFEETVLISRVNFRCLREKERVRLQKDLSNAIEKLESI